MDKSFSSKINWDIIPQEKTVLLAVSGGADSVAMLHAFAAQKERENLVIGHVNHGTRGDENESDAQFVKSLCDDYKIDFHLRRLDIPDHSEAALRTARYEALREIAQSQNCFHIVTAHTASDVLESVLLHFLRDASILGWNGIAAQRPLDKVHKKVLLLRPLLAIPRAEILQYLENNRWNWREDSSNKSTFYKRNAVRNQLLPILDELVPQGIGQLSKQAARMALLARDENEFIEQTIYDLQSRVVISESSDLIIWNGPHFADLHAAAQRRLLRLAVRKLCGTTVNLDFRRIEEVRRHIIADGRNRVWQWRGGISVHWTGPGSGRRIRISRNHAQ